MTCNLLVVTVFHTSNFPSSDEDTRALESDAQCRAMTFPKCPLSMRRTLVAGGPRIMGSVLETEPRMVLSFLAERALLIWSFKEATFRESARDRQRNDTVWVMTTRRNDENRILSDLRLQTSSTGSPHCRGYSCFHCLPPLWQLRCDWQFPTWRTATSVYSTKEQRQKIDGRYKTNSYLLVYTCCVTATSIICSIFFKSKQ